MNRTRGNFHLPIETLFPSVQMFVAIFCTTLYPLLMNDICLKQLLKYIHGGVFFIIDQFILTQTQFINLQQQTHAQVQKFLWQGWGGVLKTLFCHQRISQRVKRTSLKKQLDLRGVLTNIFILNFWFSRGWGSYHLSPSGSTHETLMLTLQHSSTIHFWQVNLNVIKKITWWNLYQHNNKWRTYMIRMKSILLFCVFRSLCIFIVYFTNLSCMAFVYSSSHHYISVYCYWSKCDTQQHTKTYIFLHFGTNKLLQTQLV